MWVVQTISENGHIGAAYPVWVTGSEHKDRIKTKIQDESLDFHTVSRELSSAMGIVARQEALAMQSSGHARGNTDERRAKGFTEEGLERLMFG
jgi:hypothetical protein